MAEFVLNDMPAIIQIQMTYDTEQYHGELLDVLVALEETSMTRK